MLSSLHLLLILDIFVFVEKVLVTKFFLLHCIQVNIVYIGTLKNSSYIQK